MMLASLRKFLISLFAFCALLCLKANSGDAADSTPSSDFVLLIHSYHQGFVWTDKQDAGIRGQFANVRPSTDIVTEYLDFKRFHDEAQIKSTREFLARKYSGHIPQLIITTDDPAFHFGLDLRKELCPNVPLVFSGVNEPMDVMPSGVAGVYEQLDMDGTFSLIFALQPETRRIFLVQDDRAPSLTLFKNLSLVVRKINPDVVLERSGGVPPEVLSQKVASLGHGDVILQADYYQSSDGRYINVEEIFSILKNNSRVPIYGIWDFSFGKGLLGGCLLEGELHGAAAAKIALRILSGTPPSEIPMQEEKQFERIVDYRQMHRFSLDVDALPHGYKVEYAPVPFFHGNEVFVLAGGVVLSVLLIALVFLVVTLIGKWRAEAEFLTQNSITKAIISVIPFDFWIRDVNDRIVLQSKESMRKWGDLTGRHTDEFEHSETWKINNQKALSGQLVDCDVEYLSGNTLRCYRCIVAPLNRNGIITGTVGMNIDVTLNRRAEEAIRNGEAILSAIFDSTNDGVIVTDSNGSIARLNPVAGKLTGFTASESIGCKISDILRLVRKETSEQVEINIAGLLSGECASCLHNRSSLLSKDGTLRQVDCSAFATKDALGKISGSVMIIHDETEERMLHEQLKQSNKWRTLGQLAGGVSHDFNNMLSVILGSAEMLALKYGNDPKPQCYVKIIREAGFKASGLVSRLLDFSKNGKFEPVSVDTHSLILDSISILERSIDRKISIETSLMAENFMVRGDSTQLQNCLLDLALKACSSISESGTMTFMTRNLSSDKVVPKSDPLFEIKPGEYIEIGVFVNGFGMGPDSDDKIFETLSDLQRRERDVEFNLSSVYCCVKDHKGGMGIYGGLGNGAVVKIFLPIVMEKSKEDLSIPKIRGRSALIMLVDDEPAVQSSTHALLSELGCDVIIAKDPMDAIDMFKTNKRIDLVILDMVMPKMNGSEVFGALRKLRPDARVLIVSGYSKGDDVQRLLDQGAQGFLQKPCNLRELTEAISSALR